MPKIDDKLAEQLKEAHGEIWIFDGGDVTDDEIAVRVPEPAEWSLYKKLALDDGKKHTSAAYIVKAITVHPEGEGLAKILAAHPGLTETWAIQAQRIAGALDGDHRRKV